MASRWAAMTSLMAAVTAAPRFLKSMAFFQ
jgi:hypothetical protein